MWGLAINLDLDQVTNIWKLLSPNSCSVASVKWGGGFHPVSGQLSSSQKSLPQLAFIGSLAGSLLSFLLSSYCFSFSFFFPPPVGGLKKESSHSSWGKNVLTPLTMLPARACKGTSDQGCWARRLIPPTAPAFIAPTLLCFAQGVSEFTLRLSILSIEPLLSSQK